MKITVLQWNIWYKEDPQNIVKLIKELDPNVVCAQELIEHSGVDPAVDTAKQIADELGYNYFYHFADRWTGREEKETQGNAIFSKFPIVKTNHHFLQEPKTDPVNASEEGRVITEVTLDINGKDLSFGTTHLSFAPFFETTESRKKEAINLVNFLREKDKNYVFTGDLNSVPGSFLLNELNELSNIKNAGPDYSEKTWTTKPFDMLGFVENDLNWRLDYVFTTNDIEVNSSEIVDTKFSDHLPILAHLTI